MKKVTLFFPLHSVPFYRQNYEKQKDLELVTSLFKLQNLLTKVPLLVWPFESGNCGKKRKKTTKHWISQEKSSVEEIIFKILSFGKIWEMEDASFEFEYSNSY